MHNRGFALFGLIGPVLAYVFIGISIVKAPWFSWWDNALSDLGHALRSESAPYFNLGLASCGFLTVAYAVTALRTHAKHTSVCLAISAFLLQLVAVFDEVYGALHLAVSVLFFISLGVSTLVYAVEKRSFAAITALTIGLSSWLLYWAGFYRAGISVPESISATAAVSWVMLSACRTYLRRP